MRRKVKIVCTMGPSTAGVSRLIELINAGMDVARMNFSHGKYEEHKKMFNDIREAQEKAKKPIAILADLCGPKIRVGDFKDNGLSLETGKMVTLTTKNIIGEGNMIPHTYEFLVRDVKKGDRILFDDGLLEIMVDSVKGDQVFCKVITGGTLKNHKGMNLPGTKLSTKALTEKDKADLLFAKELGVDYFALSFVRSPKDIIEAKALAGDIPVIAKIEKPEAVDNLDEILNVADGAMVARGDLGVEAGQEKVPLIQKNIIASIKLKAKPVITATQMLDSMINNPRPTRAEVSDVANAVLDGTDAVMLSAETSVGKYPIESVRTLTEIINEIEQSSYYMKHCNKKPLVKDNTFSNVIANASVAASESLNLASIVTYSESGKSAALLSAHRPVASIVCFSRHNKVLNKMALYWGIKPLHGEWVKGVEGIVDQAERELLKNKLVEVGDDIAINFGVTIKGEAFQTNMMKLWKIKG